MKKLSFLRSKLSKNVTFQRESFIPFLILSKKKSNSKSVFKNTFASTSDFSKNNDLRIGRIEKFYVENLTACEIFNSESDKAKKFKVNI